MTRRYFVPDLPSGGGPITLSDTESQHAIRVMRVQEGDEIELFDGIGNQARAIVTQVKRNQCLCESQGYAQISREPATVVDLGIALPKPDRAKELIERLTELGVRSVTPLIADRLQRPPSDSLLEKLSRAVVEACKQSGRNHLMQVNAAQSTSSFFSETREGTALIAHPSPSSVSLLALDRTKPVTVAIGPEGGWTEQEYEKAMSHGFLSLDLGSRIYRIETAAAAIAATLVSV